MKKFISFLITFVAIMSAIAAIAYWVYHFLYVTDHHTRLVFKSDFSDDDSLAPVPEEPVKSDTCDGAVCAVDMCMPY